MLRHTIIILILFGYSASSFSQKSFGNLKVVKADFDEINKASIIPDSIFLMNADLLLLTAPYDTMIQSIKHGFQIYWPSPFIDGRLILTISKKQISLTSGHDNPNPNRLYWFANINLTQYRLIEEKIKNDNVFFQKETSEYSSYEQLFYKKYKPELGIPKKWTDKKIQKHEKDWLKKRYLNMDDLMTFIDNGLSVDNLIPFLIQKDFNKINTVRIVFSLQDYEGQIKLAPSNN